MKRVLHFVLILLAILSTIGTAAGVGAVASIEDRIVFQDDHGGLDGVERRATGFEDAPTSS